MQSVSSRIWTRVALSISYDNNHYSTGTCRENFWLILFPKQLTLSEMLTASKDLSYVNKYCTTSSSLYLYLIFRPTLVFNTWWRDINLLYRTLGNGLTQKNCYSKSGYYQVLSLWYSDRGVMENAFSPFHTKKNSYWCAEFEENDFI